MYKWLLIASNGNYDTAIWLWFIIVATIFVLACAVITALVK